ncbi:hypothetical protein A3Q56_02872 [Intoshia linei]|uniref:Major facilitator superfamily (MFS) profile domain-containing protein n=1 Tax=Intoshia linei TaxID=1819745 RepID=A0A177B553_9BILA|nr:hypothetical protein A3Q56_02872 [Intoshia linei]
MKKYITPFFICLTSFLTNGIIFGFLNSYGLIYQYLIIENKHDENIAIKASTLGSLKNGVLFLFAGISSILCKKIGLRPTCVIGIFLSVFTLIGSSFLVHNINALFFTYGIVHSIGSSLVYIPSLSILFHHFEKRVGLANGFASVGSSVFTIILPMLLNTFLSKYGLNSLLKLEASMYFALIVGILFWNTSNKRISPQISNSTHLQVVDPNINQEKTVTDNCPVVKNVQKPTFFNSYSNQIVNRSIKGEMLIMIIGIGSAISRILFGSISDLKLINRVLLQQIAIFVCGCCFVLVPLTIQSYYIAIVCLFMGLSDGIIVCLIGPICYDLLGSTDANNGVGFSLTVISIPVSIGPLLSGVIMANTHRYDYIFYTSSCYAFISSILMILIYTTCSDKKFVKISKK